MDRKTTEINSTVESLGAKIESVKQKLGDAIMDEKLEREKQGHALQHYIEKVAKRLEAFETAGPSPGATSSRPSTTTAGGGTWRAEHFVLGGWRLGWVAP